MTSGHPWDEGFRRFSEAARVLHAAALECNAGVHMALEHHSTRYFPLRAQATFSVTSALEEDLVVALDCHAGDGPLTISADITRFGREVLEEHQSRPIHDWHGPARADEVLVRIDEAVTFLRGCTALVVREVC